MTGAGVGTGSGAGTGTGVGVGLDANAGACVGTSAECVIYKYRLCVNCFGVCIILIHSWKQLRLRVSFGKLVIGVG